MTLLIDRVKAEIKLKNLTWNLKVLDMCKFESMLQIIYELCTIMKKMFGDP